MKLSLIRSIVPINNRRESLKRATLTALLVGALNVVAYGLFLILATQ